MSKNYTLSMLFFDASSPLQEPCELLKRVLVSLSSSTCCMRHCNYRDVLGKMQCFALIVSGVLSLQSTVLTSASRKGEVAKSGLSHIREQDLLYTSIYHFTIIYRWGYRFCGLRRSGWIAIRYSHRA